MMAWIIRGGLLWLGWVGLFIKTGRHLIGCKAVRTAKRGMSGWRSFPLPELRKRPTDKPPRRLDLGKATALESQESCGLDWSLAKLRAQQLTTRARR
jgi:hypothetical protein